MKLTVAEQNTPQRPLKMKNEIISGQTETTAQDTPRAVNPPTKTSFGEKRSETRPQKRRKHAKGTEKEVYEGVLAGIAAELPGKV